MLIHSANFHLIIAHGTAAFVIDDPHTQTECTLRSICPWLPPFHESAEGSVSSDLSSKPTSTSPWISHHSEAVEDIFCPATGPTHPSSHKTLQREWVGPNIYHRAVCSILRSLLYVVAYATPIYRLLCMTKTPGTEIDWEVNSRWSTYL
ncbi:hypothetical protein BJV78DRAFT_792650 [Lactifluus subvellereus]|nr:hypothetical protein BJV78DRAFT_792650 [Lactifluus subvellereus]